MGPNVLTVLRALLLVISFAKEAFSVSWSAEEEEVTLGFDILKMNSV